MFINKSAKNPNAAKLWLDYVLSKRGQTMIANESELFAIRADVKGETTSAELTKQLGAALKPIPVSAELLQLPRPDQAPGFPEAVEGSDRKK